FSDHRRGDVRRGFTDHEVHHCAIVLETVVDVTARCRAVTLPVGISVHAVQVAATGFTGGKRHQFAFVATDGHFQGVIVVVQMGSPRDHIDTHECSPNTCLNVKLYQRG